MPFPGVGLDRYRYNNQSGQWRRRAGRKRFWPQRLRYVPLRLIFVTIAAIAALIQSVVRNHDDWLPNVEVPNWFQAKSDPIISVASVVDGDTIEIHGQRIRFNGIDAPESKQYCDDAKGFEYPCGRRSAEALEAFLALSRPVHCTFVTWDRYGRFVGDCRRADGVSVASWMVEHGQAVDWPRYSHGTYARQQEKAKSAKLGLWVGNFQEPWDWRASHIDGAQPSSQPLGIISRKLVAQSGYSCKPRRTCSQISSCEEANWYLQNCAWGGKLDRDKDGIPCESLC